MKNCILFLLTLVNIGNSCSTKDKYQLTGYWSVCYRDGSYQEHIFNENKIYLLNKFTSKDDVAVFEYRIKNDSLMGFGITKNTVKDTFQLHINVVSPNETILSNQYLQYNLEMLNEQYDLPTGSNVELWAQQAIPKFATRMAERGCLDIRTEEEKMLPDLGEIEDDFDPIYISEDSLSFD